MRMSSISFGKNIDNNTIAIDDLISASATF
jgi:hypothetical protein